MGDTLACTAAAASLFEAGYTVDFFHGWPQLDDLFKDEKRFSLHRYNPKWVQVFGGPWIRKKYTIVVIEPTPWSYQEPFTSEIRRLANCAIHPEFSLTRPSISCLTQRDSWLRPQISLSRDLYKRAYGRNINDLAMRLKEFADLIWVGLDPELDSKDGKGTSLSQHADALLASDLFIGPEGGMLWLAGGLGVKSCYLTEHIYALEVKFGAGVHKTLGLNNIFPGGPHTALKPTVSNEEIINIVQAALIKPNI